MLRKIEGQVNHQIHFFTNHTMVLAAIRKDNTIRMREIAQGIRITERAVQRIVDDLLMAGFIEVHKSGRRNVYSVNEARSLGRQMPECPVSHLLNLCGH